VGGGLYHLHEVGARSEKAMRVIVRLSRHFREVVAGGEDWTLRRQHDASRVTACDDGEGSCELLYDSEG